MMMPFNLGRRIARIRNPDTNGNIATTFVDASSDQRQFSRDVIADIVSELHDGMFSDSHTWYHWKGLTADDKARECEQFAALARGGGIDQDFMRLGISKVEREHSVTITAGTLDQASLTDDEKRVSVFLVDRLQGKSGSWVSNRHPELTCSPYFLINSPSVRERFCIILPWERTTRRSPESC